MLSLSPVEIDDLRKLDLSQIPHTELESSTLHEERQKGRREVGDLARLTEKDPPNVDEVDAFITQLLLVVIHNIYFYDGVLQGLQELSSTQHDPILERIDRVRRMMIGDIPS